MRDLGKLIAAKGFKNLPKVQKIAQSGHTGWLLKPFVASVLFLRPCFVLQLTSSLVSGAFYGNPTISMLKWPIPYGLIITIFATSKGTFNNVKCTE